MNQGSISCGLPLSIYLLTADQEPYEALLVWHGRLIRIDCFLCVLALSKNKQSRLVCRPVRDPVYHAIRIKTSVKL